MKKRMAVFVVLFIIAAATVVFILSVPWPGWPAQRRTIEEINRNCDVPFDLAMPETELKNTEGYVKEQGFGCYQLENDDVSFELSGYPDALDKYHITSFNIKSSKYTLMGLQVGCSLDKARKAMEQNGYTLDERYKKNGVVITICSSNDVVTSFYVFVETTNTSGAFF